MRRQQLLAEVTGSLEGSCCDSIFAIRSGTLCVQPQTRPLKRIMCEKDIRDAACNRRIKKSFGFRCTSIIFL